MTPSRAAGTSDEQQDALKSAYRQALNFNLDRVRALAITAERATELAQQEAAFHNVAVDEYGMTGGMRLNLLQPIHDVAASWRSCWNNFEIALQPRMPDIQAVEKLRIEAEDEKRKRDESLAAVERELRQNPKYSQTDDHYWRSKDLFDNFRDKHGNRTAVMFAKNPVYWMILALVLLTECFINYHAFNAFWGVPAVALGTTLILGVLLALAAHGHGELLKQWSFRFGPSRDPAMRWTDWRMFGMSTGALLIVLAFTGWARWAAAMEVATSQTQDSILQGVGIVQVNPLRDVMISLIANLGAWMVGVIISYIAHDSDPEYMEATAQYRKAARQWNRARSSHITRLKHIEAKAANNIEERTKAAETRLQGVRTEMDMFQQVANRGEAINRELEAVMTRNVEAYRDALVHIALAEKGQVQIVRADTHAPFSPFDYKAMKIAPAQILSQVAA